MTSFQKGAVKGFVYGNLVGSPILIMFSALTNKPFGIAIGIVTLFMASLCFDQLKDN